MQEQLKVVEHIAKTLKNSLVNLKKSPKARLTRNYLETRLKCVDEYWNKYQETYEAIIRAAPSEKEHKIPYIENNDYYEHEELYITLKSDILDLLGTKEVKVSAPISSDDQQTRVVLPKIQLPTFSGQYEDWMSFHDLFNTLVHTNKSLSDVQKLHYLKTSITGEAASILKQVQVTEANYGKAWDTLKTRYGNIRITINAIMRRFFSQKKIMLNNSNNIKHLLDTSFECLYLLNNMKVNTENWDPIIIFVIVQKLDTDTHRDWEEHVSSNCKDIDSLPSLELLRKFLENRFRTLELTEPVKPKAASVHIREKTFHVTTNENSKICKRCNEQHTLSHCKVFGNQTPKQRSEFIKLNNLCFNCLASGHSVRHCRIPTCCRLCKRRHHTLLHEAVEKNTTTSGDSKNTTPNQSEVALHTSVEKIEEEDDVTVVASHITTKQTTALLATAIVQIRSEDNYKITLRALIDQGSQASFISERAAQLLKAKRYPIKGTVVGVGTTRESIKHAVQLNLESTNEDYNLEVRTYVMSKPLSTKLPSQTITASNWTHLDGLVLADPNYFKPGSIDLLLGVDVYVQIIQKELIKGPPGSPCAHKTTLGWILFGKIENTAQQPESLLVMHHQIFIEDLLKTLWEVDGDTKRRHTKEEQQCEKFYEENHTRDSSGRYIVRLPLRTNEPITPSGNSREIAMKRLMQLERRLKQTPDLRKEYDKVLEEYLSMGHMTEVSEEDINKRSVYLPHHAVIRTDKDTTKVRVVFDASCKYNNGVSLNDELMTGPVLQEDMRSILMRWRMHKICFASDVIKMYRMILLDKQDTDYHRILWRRNNIEAVENMEAEVKDYRLNTVTFGTASAPYLAVKTLIKLAEDEGNSYPEAAKIIREDFYVDDLISGCDSREQAIEISKQIITILQRGGFELQKWASNDNEFLKHLDVSKITTRANLDIKLDGIIKALGLSWNLGEDEFRYQLQLELIAPVITKRTILSDLQKLFDPLGWIAPAIVTAKILVQRLWLEGVGWDQEITKELENEWIFIRDDLQNVNNIKIKRWLNTINTEREFVTLHGFCDASERAYAAVVYCRVKTKGNEIRTHLVAARTKVAPVKTISLPRLELCGAVLLSKLLKTASEAMRLPAHNIFAWTDSTIVLAWLLGEPNRWKPFVANRVVEILEHTNNSQWFHVQSAYNPADIASRGSSVAELQYKLLWWNGPTWLMNETIEFIRPSTSYTDIERRKTILSHVQVTEPEEKSIKFENYDSLNELLRVIVYCKKFLSLKRDQNKLESGITTEEIQTALDICIRQVQGEEYSEEIGRLKGGQSVKNTSTLKTLNPFIDKQHILRVGGRLRNANVDENLKHPVILGKRNGLVRLLLSDAHLKTLHGGINLMMSYLMSKYWIIGCKNLVKLHIQKCLTCARQRAASRQQIMGDLPEQRVTPARAFSRSGVDFAGPVHVLNSKGRGAKTRKAYICIFICMSVKAIHLELVSDLTADAFIAAFKRFVARRGKCHEIWSDNGTNFVAANKELFAMWKEAQFEFTGYITNQLASEGTQWHFTPPYSPNFGGLWEAGVKSVKQHLRKILTSRLTFEEFATVLTQIEACLNSRPLTPIPTDTDIIDNMQVLTPGHFLIGEALVSVPERSYETVNINLLNRWQHTQRLVQIFWKRWQTEYLIRLNQRPKWLRKTPEFEVGDIVLLRGENMPPSKWPLARIIHKHPGHDDMTRVYTVRCNSKNIKRSVSSLCALPVNTRDSI